MLSNRGLFGRKITAFTLVELMVVISIIGLVFSIIFAGLSEGRIKARDSRRVSDIIQIRNAIELFYADNKKYPDNTVGIYAASGSIEGKYITKVPVDSLGVPYKYNALTSPINLSSCNSNCLFFHLGAALEKKLSGGQKVLGNDRDLYFDSTPTNNAPAGDFEGSSANCETPGVEVARVDDSCYDVTP